MRERERERGERERERERERAQDGSYDTWLATKICYEPQSLELLLRLLLYFKILTEVFLIRLKQREVDPTIESNQYHATTYPKRNMTFSFGA